ncbi:MAG: hypothetical protein JWP27_1353 [Flaviaesturariibacter sp.]|nr:hypothetical protein [Flaviaesturariibacter sp.]
MSHEISLDKAIEMTTRYRDLNNKILKEEYQGRNILPRSETFDRDALDRILAQDRCRKVRIYYGMDDRDLVHAVIVGVDAEDRDILPLRADAARLSMGDDEGQIAEDSTRCPDTCPPESPLNP